MVMKRIGSLILAHYTCVYGNCMVARGGDTDGIDKYVAMAPPLVSHKQ